MGVFDLEKAAKVLGSSSDPSLLDAIGMGFGAPQCILNMTEDLLSLLPSEMLGQMGGTLKDARDAANNATALITKKLFLDSGIIEFDTETGRWKFVGDSSKWGSDGGEGDALAALGGFLGALGYAATYGATLYNNIITLDGQIQNLQACLDKFGKILAANKGSGALASNFGLGLPGVCDGGTGSTALEGQDRLPWSVKRTEELGSPMRPLGLAMEPKEAMKRPVWTTGALGLLEALWSLLGA